ncbi:hypothetical protein P4V86_03410 [Brevibacillus laterosporus]|uniref:hypothetical protein n=1 Tax=Brevibacillus laterosporus TaxID=1465 RepID=UPI00035DC0FB|nr:hypothetical protein [Brevibacillus laterosporus]ATO48570.1 hypothetical protein BrL25_05240 [Brevibacillus laterosporus DSM 25]MED2002406.1 hypothetical protein [Brevibacillus laterosporus]
MAENILLGGLRRYEFYSYCSDFPQELNKVVNQDLYGDIHWKWTYIPDNPYAKPKASNSSHNSYPNEGTITAQNVKDPSLFFTICLNYSYFYSNSKYPKRNYVLRTGFRNNGADVKPDLFTDVGAITEIPFHVTTESTSTSDYLYNVYFKWSLLITDRYIFLYGEPQTYQGIAIPVRIYFGRLKPFEAEDPLIANDFVGVFSHYPCGLNDANDELKYRAGRGYVRSSRNGTKNALYHFATSSQVPSPGVGGRFFISPFYVWHATEGVRGEFQGVRTAVLKDASKYPDGSILDLGTERYHVFHAFSESNPDSYEGWYATDGKYYKGQPYFFDSPLLLGGGQRVLLFEIEREV